MDDDFQPFNQIKDQLNLYVNRIDQYFDTVHDKHDREFIAAYKNQMLKHRKTLIEYKKKAEDAAGAVLKDDKVTGLQNQLAWFRTEAVKLDEMVQKQYREIKKYESRDTTIKEDNKFLKEQTIQAMKQNKQLKAQVAKTTDTNKAIRDFLEKNKPKEPLTKSMISYRRIVGDSSDTFQQMLDH